jgi:predicted secreted hydrolase
MGHASISDLPTGRHVFSETLYRAVPLLGGFGTAGDSLIAWSRAPAGTEDCWTLSFDGEAFDFRMRDEARGMAFDLSAKPLKPLVFQGPGGFSPKGDEPSAASLYTSFTRMATTGRLEIEGRSYRVKGQSWMDREFGSNQLTEAQVGWDWFSLQLDGGRELMLYHLRDRTGAVDFARGTLVSSDGTTVYLKESDWTLEALDHWESPETEARYPVRWRLRLPAAALDLEIAALMPNQENVSRLTPGLHYWEGAVLVRQAVGSTSGAPVGRGYLELTGYGAGSRPPI